MPWLGIPEAPLRKSSSKHWLTAGKVTRQLIPSRNGLRACPALSCLPIGHPNLNPSSRSRLKLSCLPSGSSGSAGDPPLFGLQRLAETLFPGAGLTERDGGVRVKDRFKAPKGDTAHDRNPIHH